MKPAFAFRRFMMAALACGVVVACLPDQISWSPDGRYVAFVRPADKGLWIWDSQTEGAA